MKTIVKLWMLIAILIVLTPIGIVLPQHFRAGAENKIYTLILSEPVHIDEFIEKTNLDITCVSDILLSLRLKKLIKEIPGKRYIRS